MDQFTFEDMGSITREQLGNQVPLELFRTIRLIGLYQGLPMGGKGTTLTVGRKIGESLPVDSLEELMRLLQQLKIGIPRILETREGFIKMGMDDCFCKGLPIIEEKMVCDLEGAVMEGALSRIWNTRVSVRETKCNVSGHPHCEYEIRY
ncbi:V4R domain-containing protein [Paenibacillus sp. J22TS3]|uniref:V4R domain-containing protein n=1 Tax=Paenibacillus sp. J22TS3 TaxID=2807192 RepID=UPI001B184F62|nr:V4R domain-containing protein [Paenibacillus sp. J22TS3]GIP23206.1 hypothetical protein J22TS3_34810 [Paenibacillus sp. J22TS3]